MTGARPARASASALARRQRLIVLSSASMVTASAWLLLATTGHGPGAALAPHHAPSTLWSLLAAVAMWQAMMVAMMGPLVMPWLALIAALADPAAGRGGLRSSAAFAGGYFVIWLAYAVVAGAAQVILQRAALVDLDLGMSAAAGGVVLVAAGLFQLAPLKRACLAHCRSPLGYFLSRWENGPIGGFRLGIGHGLFCLGCCWALMAVAFAIGVMNLAWMAVLTVILCVEQLAPAGDRIGRVLGVLLVAWGLALAIG